MQRILRALHQLPIGWIAFALGLFIFTMTRLLPGADWQLPPTAQARLDEAYIEVLQEDMLSYSLLENEAFVHRQTRGAHILPQMLRALLGMVIGDSTRAGIWLSMMAVLATLAGGYTLCHRILPLRGYCLITVIALAGVGSLQFAIRPDASVALGMALVIWGYAFFLAALDREMPMRAFLSAIFFGLAGYIRLELGLIWLLLAGYMLCLAVFPSQAKQNKTPLGAMALGGIFIVALMLWPLIHVNMKIAQTPILPGPDAEMIFGAPAPDGYSGPSFLGRLFLGFRVLLLDPVGLGMLAGLLWPAGMVISLLTHRHKAVPCFWLPTMFFLVALMTFCSLITGLDSYLECLQIISPLLLPFSVLAVVYPFFRWMQEEPRSFSDSRKAWAMAVLAVYLMVQLPHVFRQMLDLTHAARLREKTERQLVELIQGHENLPTDAVVLTDMPGVLLQAGWKADCVLGVGGETDWEVQQFRMMNGALNPRKLPDYLVRRKVQFVHFSDAERANALLREIQAVLPGSIVQEVAVLTGFDRELFGYLENRHQMLRITYDPSVTP